MLWFERIRSSGSRARGFRIVGACAAVFTIVVLLSALPGCGADDGIVDRRLLLIGLDGAEWSVVGPLVEQGRLPNIAALMESGVSCRLRSLEPKQKSPVIWTTMSTGKLPHKHGITDFLDPISKRPLTSNIRTARTVWDILGEHELTVTVVGWLVSWPAEEVNGTMVTDYFRYRPREGSHTENLTYPEGLVDEVAPLRVLGEGVSDATAERFCDLENAMTGEEAQRLDVDRMFVEMRAISDLEQKLATIKDHYASDETFAGVARHLMRTRPTDVAFVYLRGTDSMSHKFWPASFPEEVQIDVPETDIRVFGDTMERYYERADSLVGELVSEFGRNATVMLCADHGFEGPRPGRSRGGINDHGPIGVFVLSGDGVRSGVEIAEHSVRDITPTILALYGLPVGEDMDGEVMRDAFEDDFLREHPLTTIPTYEVNEPTEVSR